MQQSSNLRCRRVGLCMFVSLVYFTPGHVAGQTPLHVRIDQAIQQKSDYTSIASPIASDAEFLRRIYLDLSGVIPTADQARAFFTDKSSDKRAKIIERLLAEPEYARHLQHMFDVLLMDRRPDKYVKAPQWQEYLRKSFAENKPYDQLIREILSADGSDPKTKAQARFYLDREGEPHQLTRDISRIFLGMNLECAQCHDHPIVDAYDQEHYYGIYAFLNRSYVFNDKKKKRVIFAEKGEGEVSFESVFVPKVTKKTGPRLPFGPMLAEPKLEKGKIYKVAPKKGVQPIPNFSRRSYLGKMLTDANNERFRRAAVGHFWTMMFGRGIVQPVDFDHPANPPSHPELLKLLTDEFAKSGYDIKFLLREIALSKTYQRSSAIPSHLKEAPEERFAVAKLRSLTPEQFAWSIIQATGQLETQRKALGSKFSEKAFYDRVQRLAAPIVKMFSGSPGEPAELGFQATLDQTLFITNGALIRTWLVPRTGSLTDRMRKAKNEKEMVDELFLSVLTRLPNDTERQAVIAYLAGRKADRDVALQEMAWAMLASVEFRFNH